MAKHVALTPGMVLRGPLERNGAVVAEDVAIIVETPDDERPLELRVSFEVRSGVVAVGDVLDVVVRGARKLCIVVDRAASPAPCEGAVTDDHFTARLAADVPCDGA